VTAWIAGRLGDLVRTFVAADEMVSQEVPSWNQFRRWLIDLEELRKSAQGTRVGGL
jgi:hypothetical protein